jgi:acetoacetyl-CoA reductase
MPGCRRASTAPAFLPRLCRPLEADPQVCLWNPSCAAHHRAVTLSSRSACVRATAINFHQQERQNMTAKQRVVLVTGGMGGLGETISTKMVDAGYRVVVTYSPGNTTYTQWLDGMKANGYEILGVPCDVSDFDSCTRAVAEVQSKAGAVDVLVNNAGITRDTTFKKMDKVNWDAVMRTNLDSLFNMTKQVADGMVERSWGRIINISSVNGSKGAFGQTNYSAAKAGVHGFTKALALEVAKKNVTVNTISPGYIGTKMVTAIPEDVLNSKILPQIPVGRLGKPEEVAGLVIYLASEEAAFVTGANIAINGGQHMQ